MELERLREVYRRRDESPRLSALYEPDAAGNRFLAERRAQAIHEMLRSACRVPLSAARLLDLGCGAGDDAARFHAYAIDVVGVDLLAERLTTARGRCPQLGFAQGNAAELPFAAGTFDVVFQSMVFSSILDEGLRRRAVSEMLRVLKPDGLILWYDFWWNPTNRATRGIRLAHLRRLFQGCEVRARRVTLAPPLARRIAPITLRGAQALEAVPLLRTHYCAAIRRQSARA